MNLDLKTTQVQQTETTPTRDPAPFKAFLSEFSKDQRKQFLKNMTRHFSHIITRQMRKMKEANERFRESFQKK